MDDEDEKNGVIIQIKKYYELHVYNIVMERYLTSTLTSDHISNARNEFLRSVLCKRWYCA